MYKTTCIYTASTLQGGGVAYSHQTTPNKTSPSSSILEYTPTDQSKLPHCNNYVIQFPFECNKVTGPKIKQNKIAPVIKTSQIGPPDTQSLTVSLTHSSKNLHNHELIGLHAPKPHTFMLLQSHNEKTFTNKLYYHFNGDYLIATVYNPDGSEFSEHAYHISDSTLYLNHRFNSVNKNKVFALRFSDFKEKLLANSHSSPLIKLTIDFKTFVFPQEPAFISATQSGLIIETEKEHPSLANKHLLSYMFFNTKTKILTEFNKIIEITDFEYPDLRGANNYFMVSDTLFPLSDGFSELPFLPKPANPDKNFYFFDDITKIGDTSVLTGLYHGDKQAFVKLAIGPDTYSMCSSSAGFLYPGTDHSSFYQPNTQSLLRFKEDINSILFPFLAHTEPTKDLPELGGLAAILIVLVLCLCGAGGYHKNRRSNVLPVQSEPPQQGQEQFIEITTVNVSTDTYENNNSIRNPRNTSPNKMSKTTQKSNKIPANKKYEV